MALDPLSSWTARLLAMPQVDSQSAGATNLANFYGDMADKVQADAPEGSSVGIFTFNRSLFVSTLLSSGFGPDATIGWVSNVGAAYATALAGSTITAGTVTDSATWTASTVDSATDPTGASVIITIATAKATLESGLLGATTIFYAGTITNPSEAEPAISSFAQAWRDATLEFIFNCKGIAAGVPPVIVPKTFPAI